MLAIVKDRRVIKMAVTSSAKEAIEEISRRYDLKEYALAGRIFDWFVAQDDIYQRAVLGFLEGLEVDAAEAFLKRKARNAKLKEATPPDQSPVPPSDQIAGIVHGADGSQTVVHGQVDYEPPPPPDKRPKKRGPKPPK